MTEPTKQRATPGRKKRRMGILIFGLLLLLAASVVLFWNEWRSASQVATLIAGERGLMSVDLGRVPRDVGGRLVYVAGPARPSGPVEDPLFPIGHVALRLDRIVEMYQWREQSEGSGDNRSTRYERIWAEGRIASERFRERVGRINPPAPPVESERFHPAEVVLGAYGVSTALIDLLHANEAITVPQGAELFARGLALKGEGTAFVSGDASRPEIGDVRVRFRVVPAGEISVLAGLDGALLRPWTAPNGRHIAMVEAGLESARSMLANAHRKNALRTWAIRAAGTLVLFVGLSLLVGHLSRRFSKLAYLKATRAIPIPLTFAVAWAVLIIALAWAIFRPLVSLGLVVLSVALVALVSAFHAWRGRLAVSGSRSDGQ